MEAVDGTGASDPRNFLIPAHREPILYLVHGSPPEVSPVQPMYSLLPQAFL